MHGPEKPKDSRDTRSAKTKHRNCGDHRSPSGPLTDEIDPCRIDRETEPYTRFIKNERKQEAEGHQASENQLSRGGLQMRQRACNIVPCQLMRLHAAKSGLMDRSTKANDRGEPGQQLKSSLSRGEVHDQAQIVSPRKLKGGVFLAKRIA